MISPTANVRAAVVAEDSGSNSIDVLANDSDANGDTLTILSVTSATNGTVGLSGGVVTYSPDPDYFGSDSFSYTISDGTESDTAAVTVNVTNAGREVLLGFSAMLAAGMGLLVLKIVQVRRRPVEVGAGTIVGASGEHLARTTSRI